MYNYTHTAAILLSQVADSVISSPRAIARSQETDAHYMRKDHAPGKTSFLQITCDPHNKDDKNFVCRIRVHLAERISEGPQKPRLFDFKAW
jgi:hypothetical protein